MLNLSSMLANKTEQRAAAAWRRIGERPTSVVFKTTAGVTLAAQTVRVESDNRPALVSSAAGVGSQMQIVVYGVRDHATVADTVMDEGYRFVLSGDEYRVTDIILQRGEIQGIAVRAG